MEQTKQTLGEIMKEYEHQHRRKLSKDSYILMRLDGKSFHSYTRGLKKPYDLKLMEAMDNTLLKLCEQIQGVRFGYVESDEISLLISNDNSHEPKIDGNEPELWMGGIEAKMLSLSAAIASTQFNSYREKQLVKAGLAKTDPNSFHKTTALFDSRLWTFPKTSEGRDLVSKYFFWRVKDSYKNSVTMAASVYFSNKELHGLNTAARINKLKEINQPWESLPDGFKYGRYAVKEAKEAEVSYFDKRTNTVEKIITKRKKWPVRPLEQLFDFREILEVQY
mgnify:CR=1 FL=1